jgi:hypothetical protein
MNDIQRLNAFFAKEAYSKDPVKSYSGYNLVHSDPFTKVYRSDIDKKQIIAVRGTEGFKDMLLDAQLGLGKSVRSSDRYKRSEDVVKRYFDPRYNMEFAAHSLGGAISNELSKRFGANASLFNPYINREGISTAATVIRTSDDPLQKLNSLGGTDKIAKQMAKDYVDIGSTGGNLLQAHSIEAFN